ncbi:MAG: hypothetical protein QM820_27315 [Minicystis sp.]
MKAHRYLLSILLGLATLLVWGQKAQAATSLSSVSNSCWTTEQPFTLVDDEQAKLTWDVYGNLTLVNHNGGGTQVKWGLDSPVPLTGANAGKLCFGNGRGRLRIHDATGNMIWVTGEYDAPNGILSIDQCTVTIKSTSGAVMWQESTPECDRRRLPKPTVNKCWSAADTQTILWDDEHQVQLIWFWGMLFVLVEGDVVWKTPNNPRAPGQLCYQTDGNLVIYDSLGNMPSNAMWASGSNTSVPMVMSADECGVVFSHTNYTPPGQSAPVPRAYKRFGGTCEQPAINQGWCRTSAVPGTIVRSASSHVDWTSDGKLKLYDAVEAVAWQSNSQTGQTLCFQNDGNLVVYSSSGTTLWADGAVSPKPQQLNLDGCTFSSVIGKIATLCSLYHQDAVKECNPLSHCTAEEQDDWNTATLFCIGSSSSYTRWKMTPSTCAAPLPGGGFSYLKERKDGNSTFGAQLWIVGAALQAQGIDTLKGRVAGTGAMNGVNADLPTGTPPAGYFEVLGDAGAGATLFGQSFTVMEANGFVENLDGPVDSFTLTAMGATVYSLGGSGVVNKSVSKDFFELDETYMIGPIPVTMTATVSGKVGLSFNAYGTSDSLTTTMTPYASLDLEASVGVGVSGASAGVEGELNLVQLSFPYELSITSFANRTYKNAIDFQVSTLSGEIDLYAELGFLKAKKEIASFGGFSTGTRLYAYSGSI